ncbi:MAG: GNAT family N-acetyltransferase [Actinobacteria bacterium]|nr:GNAT family N-acetyltransferase [Actinomycetota bacterium]
MTAGPPAAARAGLIEDGGAAAASAEFFRSPAFLAAEGATHTLRIETDAGAELLAPLVVRPIGADPERDASSPYGFPGLAAPDGLLLDPAAIDFAATGLVSVFFRHRLGPPPLAGASPRNVVQIADPALPRKSRPSDRRQIRRNRERGYELELVPGADADAAQRAGFVDLYEQTMRRTDAARRYFFDPSYFDRVLSAERTWLALATDPRGELAAASIATVSDGYLHYYLSGSADARLSDSPMKNVVALLVDHAEELGLPLNLGGGISRGDALEEFKRGFANREQQWFTSEVVCDPAAYERLSAGREAGGFFPAYRAP